MTNYFTGVGGFKDTAQALPIWTPQTGPISLTRVGAPTVYTHKNPYPGVLWGVVNADDEPAPTCPPT